MIRNFLKNISLKLLLSLFVLAFGFSQAKSLGDAGVYKPFAEAHGDKFSLGTLIIPT